MKWLSRSSRFSLHRGHVPNGFAADVFTFAFTSALKLQKRLEAPPGFETGVFSVIVQRFSPFPLFPAYFLSNRAACFATRTSGHRLVRERKTEPCRNRKRTSDS